MWKWKTEKPSAWQPTKFSGRKTSSFTQDETSTSWQRVWYFSIWCLISSLVEMTQASSFFIRFLFSKKYTDNHLNQLWMRILSDPNSPKCEEFLHFFYWKWKIIRQNKAFLNVLLGFCKTMTRFESQNCVKFCMCPTSFCTVKRNITWL